MVGYALAVPIHKTGVMPPCFNGQQKTLMNKLTRKEILTVFSKYIGCAAIIFDSDEPVSSEIEVIDLPGETVMCDGVAWIPEDLKLILRPVSHLSGNDILTACGVYDSTGTMYAKYKNIEFRRIENLSQRIVIQDTGFSYLFDCTTGAISLYNRGTHVWSADTQLYLAQWYFNNRVAIPLHFEPGHWANGKNAIELGIAVPSNKLLNELLLKMFNNDKGQVQEWYFDKKLHGVNLFDLPTLNETIAELKKELSLL